MNFDLHLVSRLTPDHEEQLVKRDGVREEKDCHGFQGNETGKELVQTDDAEEKEKVRGQKAERNCEGVVLDEFSVNQRQVVNVEISCRQRHIKGHREVKSAGKKIVLRLLVY